MTRILIATVVLCSSLGFPATTPAEVTAVVNNGTLEITKDTDPRTLKGITLRNDQNGDIEVDITAGGVLGPFTAASVQAIDIRGEFSVTFDIDFVGDVSVDVLTGGSCTFLFGEIDGDVQIESTSGSVVVTLHFFDFLGDFAVIGGPGADRIVCDFGDITVGGNMLLDLGPGNDSVFLLGFRPFRVEGQTTIKLGQGQNAATSSDGDTCVMARCSFGGSIFVLGESGDDFLIFDLVEIEANLDVDMGNGMDSVRLGKLFLGADSILFIDGGNGNGDELDDSGFALNSDEYAGFEAVIP